MITFGFAKAYQYTVDGLLQIQVRIPSVHGPYKPSDWRGKTARNYVQDKDLPWYNSVLLPHLPNDGDVVAVAAMEEGLNNFLVIGITGANYNSGITNVDLR